MNAAQRHLEARRQKNIIESADHVGLKCIAGPFGYVIHIGDHTISFAEHIDGSIVYTISHIRALKPKGQKEIKVHGRFDIKHGECCHNYDDFIHHILDLIRRGE